VLEAKSLSKTYSNGVHALNGLDLTVRDGELCCFMGPNGAGKSTTINLFLNYIQPSDGAALVDGISVCGEPLETRRRTAYVPEQVALYGTLSAKQNITFFARLAGRTGAIDYEHWLDLVGLNADVLSRRVQSFSKGMRQRLALAIALLKGARNLLLDEPTSGLDPKAAAAFVDLLTRLRDDGYAILISSHDLFRVTEVADVVAIMCQGKLCAKLEGSELERCDINALYLNTVDEHTRPPSALREERIA
jgi:ABC-2 type transport system ATP-binding protein